jgi:hypothetical protein
MSWRDVAKQVNVWRRFFPASILVVNSLTWWVFANVIFSEAINNLPIFPLETLTLFSIYYVGVAISFILGATFFPRSRKTPLSFWMLTGAMMSILLITIPNNNVLVNMFISFFFGVSVGAGLPSSLACFADATIVENRGFFGGITYFFVGFITMLLLIIMFLVNNIQVVLMVVLWRIVGLILFFFIYKDEKSEYVQNVPSYAYILRKRESVLYLVPWIMFCLVNWMEAPLLENLFSELYSLIGFIEVALSGIFALAGGIIADFSGRKRVIIMGFIILGIEYAVLSLLYWMPVSWYIYTAFDGIAWGMFASVFFMSLWGDLAGDYQKEKFYAVGGLPYILASFLSILVKPYVGIIPLGTAFSLASFFLFLAVLPLMYASETLPEKKIRERELKHYIEKAKKIREKHP